MLPTFGYFWPFNLHTYTGMLPCWRGMLPRSKRRRKGRKSKTTFGVLVKKWTQSTIGFLLSLRYPGHIMKDQTNTNEVRIVTPIRILTQAEVDALLNDLDGDEDHYSTSDLAHYRAIEASKEIL